MDAWLPLICVLVIAAAAVLGAIYLGSTTGGRVITGAADLGPVPPPDEPDGWEALCRERAAAERGEPGRAAAWRILARARRADTGRAER